MSIHSCCRWQFLIIVLWILNLFSLDSLGASKNDNGWERQLDDNVQDKTAQPYDCTENECISPPLAKIAIAKSIWGKPDLLAPVIAQAAIEKKRSTATLEMTMQCMALSPLSPSAGGNDIFISQPATAPENSYKESKFKPIQGQDSPLPPTRAQPVEQEPVEQEPVEQEPVEQESVEQESVEQESVEQETMTLGGALASAPSLMSSFIVDFPVGHAAYFGHSIVPGQHEPTKRLQELIYKLVSLPSNKPVPTLISHWPKGSTWFEVLIRLHFANHSVDNFSNEALGLDGEGDFEQHIVYRTVLDRLRQNKGIRNFFDYKAMMDWLVRLDLIRDFPSQKVLKQIPGWLKTMRAELVHMANPGDEHQRKPFDPQIDNTPGHWELITHSARHIRLKFQILQTFLENAPQEWLYKVVHSWLHDIDQKDARKLLFAQDAYPLNTNFDHFALWVVLVDCMAKHLPDPNKDASPLTQAFCCPYLFNQSYPCEEEILSPRDLQHKIKSIFGRTVVFHPSDGFNHYLKIQAMNETNSDFRITTARIGQLKDLQDSPMVSDLVQVERIVKVMSVKAFLGDAFPAEDIGKVLDLTGKGRRLAVKFTLPEDVHYENYVYDLPTRDQKISAITRYLQDFAELWKQGINGPGPINAYHDVDQGRLHMTFPILACPFWIFEGSVERWNGATTDYPNIGAPGMRDLWDARLWTEKAFICLSGRTFCAEELSLMQRKLRVLNLANTAKGVILVYGRCFNKEFDYRNKEYLKQVEQEIAELMVCFFCRAFPISQEFCHTVMRENGLLEQVAREVCYWMADYSSEVFYVQDLREGKINHAVYPHLPEKMQGCILSERNRKFLTDYGFHDPKRDRAGESQLGAGSGRTPLIALNAMLAKLITAGITASIQAHQE